METIIKLIKAKEERLNGKYDIIRVVGENVNSGKPFDKFFFANNDKLQRELDNFGPGETLTVVQDDTKFKNISGFKAASAEDVAKAESTPAPAAKSSGGGGWKKPEGATRGDDTNRSAAIYLVKDIVMATKKPADLVKMSAFDLVTEMISVSEMVNDYIKDGIVPDVNDSGDPLDPPTV